MLPLSYCSALNSDRCVAQNWFVWKREVSCSDVRFTWNWFYFIYRDRSTGYCLKVVMPLEEECRASFHTYTRTWPAKYQAHQCDHWLTWQSAICNPLRNPVKCISFSSVNIPDQKILVETTKLKILMPCIIIQILLGMYSFCCYRITSWCFLKIG